MENFILFFHIVLSWKFLWSGIELSTFSSVGSKYSPFHKLMGRVVTGKTSLKVKTSIATVITIYIIFLKANW